MTLALVDDLRAAPSGELRRIILRGSPLADEVLERVQSAPLSMSTGEVTQLELTIADVDLELFATRVFALGARVDYADLRFRIAAHEVSGADGGTVTVQCRPAAVHRLRQRVGKRVMRNASPSDFVVAECKAVGARYVVEPTARRPQVARDVRKKGSSSSGPDAPSSWSTFDRLAREEGFLVFEAADVIYFGRPTWLLKRPRVDELLIDAGSVDDDEAPDDIPTCRRSIDAPDAATVDAELPLWRADEIRPGRRLRLAGVPTFAGAYLIDAGSFDLAALDGTATVAASTPEDPDPAGWQDSAGTAGVAGKGPHKELVDAAIAAGFRGESLIIAIAVALAESRGEHDAVNVNSNGTRDLGAWQINTVHTGSGFRPARAFDVRYNAQMAWTISDGGRDWSPWVTFKTGAYKEHLATARRAVETTTSSDGPAPGRGNGQSALDFVTVMLSQLGDPYDYGAEANPNDPNPERFDCSELIEWACAQVGVKFVDGSANQIAAAREIPLAEARKTRGALLYMPGHVAISLGDGRTIESAGGGAQRVYIGSASQGFTRGGLIPGLRY